jgi:hypothetical protein
MTWRIFFSLLGVAMGVLDGFSLSPGLLRDCLSQVREGAAFSSSLAIDELKRLVEKDIVIFGAENYLLTLSFG